MFETYRIANTGEILLGEECGEVNPLQAALADLNRVSVINELTASLAGQITEPIAAALCNAEACLLWLAHEEPDLTEIREAATEMLKETRHAADIIRRIRSL
jgi:hypothetical protein